MLNNRFVFVYRIIGKRYRIRRKVAVICNTFESAFAKCDSFIREQYPEALDFYRTSYTVENLVGEPDFTD